MAALARFVVVLIAVLLAPFDVRAQEPPAPGRDDGPWVASRSPDGRVNVLTTRGIWVEGRIIDLTPDALTLLVRDRPIEVRRSEVFEVWEPRRRGGLLKGAVVGALAMLAIGTAAWATDECRQPGYDCAPDEEFKAEDIGWATVGGALIGGLVGGALIEGRPATLLYSKTLAAPAGAARPALQRASVVRVSLRF